jgi:uncharacterized protein
MPDGRQSRSIFSRNDIVDVVRASNQFHRPSLRGKPVTTDLLFHTKSNFETGMTTEDERLRAHIAQELRVAMKARNASRVAALRSLAAALDNATAVPMPPRVLPNEKSEVPRKTLSLQDVRAVLTREIAERRHAASTLTAHARLEEAAAVEAEIAILEQYIDWS